MESPIPIVAQTLGWNGLKAVATALLGGAAMPQRSRDPAGAARGVSKALPIQNTSGGSVARERAGRAQDVPSPYHPGQERKAYRRSPEMLTQTSL